MTATVWCRAGWTSSAREELTAMADTPTRARGDRRRTAAAEPDLDLLREGLRVLRQAVREAALDAHLGAER